MATARMDDIRRQRDPVLKAAVESSATVDQQAWGMLFRTRDLLVRQRTQAEPGGEVPSAPEGLHRRREGLDSHRGDRADPRHGHQTAHLVVLPGRRPDFPVKAKDLLAKPGNLVQQKAGQITDRSMG